MTSLTMPSGYFESDNHDSATKIIVYCKVDIIVLQSECENFDNDKISIETKKGIAKHFRELVMVNSR